MEKNINKERFYTTADIERQYVRQYYPILKCFMIKKLKYFSMSFESKFLYGILYDRNDIYFPNRFVNDDGIIYFIINEKEIEVIKKITNWSTKKINKCLKELKEFELLKTVNKEQGEVDLNYLILPSLK